MLGANVTIGNPKQKGMRGPQTERKREGGGGSGREREKEKEVQPAKEVET